MVRENTALVTIRVPSTALNMIVVAAVYVRFDRRSTPISIQSRAVSQHLSLS
jgi:hypothetical protein